MAELMPRRALSALTSRGFVIQNGVGSAVVWGAVWVFCSLCMVVKRDEI
ncbi:hypothetical protein RSSM_00822 [Rhodopirellula sallentina SM41]|uniref:Uncharacterized protein n=1 Tax=Rhodopirellula sallentina SM41 TaxID=1263870 RepID=M5UNZ7_9BACT|nr:hypothetical protein RSSM_00822 [Rhodopirellula sallentina SM41]